MFICKGCISGTNISFAIRLSDNDWTWPDTNFPFIANRNYANKMQDPI